MNFLLTSHRGNVQKRRVNYTCFYCRKSFKSSRALGSHLKSHQNNVNSSLRMRNLSLLNHSNTCNDSLSIANPNPNPFMTTDCHPHIHYFSREDNPWKNQIISSPTRHINPNPYCQFNTENPLLPNFDQNHRNRGDMNNLGYPSFAPSRHTNPSFVSTPPILPRLSTQTRLTVKPEGYGCQCRNKRRFTDEVSEVHYKKDEFSRRVSKKRPKMHENDKVVTNVVGVPKKHGDGEKKELLLFKDMVESFSGLDIKSSYEVDDEELSTNLDLSLHL
uniref:C2H2-type domain-containing protein n=1 Tax=Cannabis sativa TaxID=3483 RepID=A0A803QEN2_CANSA